MSTSQQQTTTTTTGPQRFYQQFKKPSDSLSSAPAPSPIVTLSDFSFNARPSFTSTRSEAIDASATRPQTLLHASLPNSTSTGSSHTRNLTLPITRPKTRSEPSQHRPQLSLILSSDASTLVIPNSKYQTATTSTSNLRLASYSAGQTANQQSTKGPIERSPTPFARLPPPQLPTPDSNPRSRSSSITNTSSSHDRAHSQTSSPKKPPPVPPRPTYGDAGNNHLMQKPPSKLINNRPDPLRSNPPSPPSDIAANWSYHRSRSHSHPTKPPPRPPKIQIPHRSSDPYTRGQERPPIPAGLNAASIAPSQQSTNSSPDQPKQQHGRSYSSSHANEIASKSVRPRPVCRSAASDPLPTTFDDILSPSTEEASSPFVAGHSQSAQPAPSSSSSPPAQPQIPNETTEPSRRRSFPLSNMSTPPSRDSAVSASTSTHAGNRQSSNSSDDKNKPLPSMPSTTNEVSINDLYLSERIRQPRLSLNSLRNLSLLPKSSKSNLHSNSQSPSPSPSPLFNRRPNSRWPSTAASSTSSSSHTKSQSQSTMGASTQAQRQPQPQTQTQTQTQTQARISAVPSSTTPNTPSQLPSSNSGSNPSSPLLSLTSHVQNQLTLATHLFMTYSAQLAWTEKNWMESTISDTERAIAVIKFLTESLRIEEETNNGRIGIGSRMKWALRDSRKAKERREDLVLVSASLGRVLARLQSIQSNFPQGPGEVEADTNNTIAEAASKELTSAATSLPVSKQRPRVPTTTIKEAASSPSAASAGKPPSPPWDLTVQHQDPGMELVVDNGIMDNQSVNSSTVQFAVCDPERTTLNTPPPPAISPPPPPPSTELDEELLEMLSWRWNRGRVSATQ
ncbi:hypothetical protein BDV06DRAFT_203891 [Aspergillus oleicola]